MTYKESLKSQWERAEGLDLGKKDLRIEWNTYGVKIALSETLTRGMKDTFWHQCSEIWNLIYTRGIRNKYIKRGAQKNGIQNKLNV